MKNTGKILLISMLCMSVALPSVSAADLGIIADQHNVSIALATNGLRVEEFIRVTNTDRENATTLRFWIQQSASDVSIRATQSGIELIPLISQNIRTCNLSAANLTIPPQGSLDINIVFTLPTTTENFEQTLLYDTTALSVTYNEQKLFQGEHLLYRNDANNALEIRLYKPTEAPLSMLAIIIIFVLVVILFASLLLLLRKKRSRPKTSMGESEETLTMKKTLLLSLLKDLEKQYRSSSISDETYTKLKEEYKQQAVDTMKKLDDLKR